MQKKKNLVAKEDAIQIEKSVPIFKKKCKTKNPTKVLPLVPKEDTIRVEHWDNLEDEVLPETASDVVRRHKKVN